MIYVYLYHQYIYCLFGKKTNLFRGLAMKSQVWSPLQLCHVVCAWYACVDTRNSPSPLKFQWSLSPDHCVVVEPFFHVRLLCNNCTVLARQRVDCRFCREEYGEETLATVVSGLALGVYSPCLIIIPLSSSEVALCGPYLPGSRVGPNHGTKSTRGWRWQEG